MLVEGRLIHALNISIHIVHSQIHIIYFHIKIINAANNLFTAPIKCIGITCYVQVSVVPLAAATSVLHAGLCSYLLNQCCFEGNTKY